MSRITKIPGRSGKWTELYEVQSESRANVSYVVANDGHQWGCSCPQWIFHTPRHDCKHIRSVRQEISYATRLQTYTPAEVEARPAIKKALSRFALVEA